MFVSKDEMLERLALDFLEDKDITLPDLIQMINSITSGNYKIHADNSKEEITMGFYDKPYFGSRKISVKEKFRYYYDFSTKVDDKGNANVHLDEIDLSDALSRKGQSSHDWIFTTQAIIEYLEAHPMNVYDHVGREGLIGQTIDGIITPLRMNSAMVIEVDRQTETVNEIYWDSEVEMFFFMKTVETNAINPQYRHDIDRAAWCHALLAVFKSIHADDFYGSKYDLTVKLRGVPRFVHLMPMDPDNPNGPETIKPFYRF